MKTAEFGGSTPDFELRGVLTVFYGLARRRDHHLEVFFHSLNEVEIYGDVFRRRLGRVGIALAAEHQHVLRSLDLELPPF